MLARLLSGCVPVAHDSAGAIFIDRDGDLFRHVLAFLRDGPRAALPADADTLRALAVDADYYQLDGLKEAVNERLPEEGSLSPATARARARRAGPDGVLDAAHAADGGRRLAALELLAGLAVAPGAAAWGGGGGGMGGRYAKSYSLVRPLATVSFETIIALCPLVRQRLGKRDPTSETEVWEMGSRYSVDVQMVYISSERYKGSHMVELH